MWWGCALMCREEGTCGSWEVASGSRSSNEQPETAIPPCHSIHTVPQHSQETEGESFTGSQR